MECDFRDNHWIDYTSILVSIPSRIFHSFRDVTIACKGCKFMSFLGAYRLWARRKDLYSSIQAMTQDLSLHCFIWNTTPFSVKSPLQQVRGTEDLFYPYSHGITLSSTLSVTRLPFYLANPLPPSPIGQFPEHTRHSDSPRGDWQTGSQLATAKRNNRKFSWKTKHFSKFSQNLLTIQEKAIKYYSEWKIMM